MLVFTFDQHMFATVSIPAADEAAARRRLDEILADLDCEFIDGSTSTLIPNEGPAELVEVNPLPGSEKGEAR